MSDVKTWEFKGVNHKFVTLTNYQELEQKAQKLQEERDILFDAHSKEMTRADELDIENQRLREQYNELIMAVAQKWPNESRHETALRYIKQAEAPKDHQCVAQNKE